MAAIALVLVANLVRRVLARKDGVIRLQLVSPLISRFVLKRMNVRKTTHLGCLIFYLLDGFYSEQLSVLMGQYASNLGY